MLIFDPPDQNPMAQAHSNLIGSSRGGAKGSHSSRFREHRYVFDRLFDQSASQNDVFNATTRPLLDSVLDGYNATVFAYGATGCGKTHTISGTPDDPGIIFLTMQELFERIEQLKDEKVVELTLSYLEIYNETIRDLLNPATPNNNNNTNSSNKKLLVLREDADRRITVSNLSSHRPENVHQVMDMIVKGNTNRTMSPTEANAVSSRSHAVIQINVSQRPRTASLQEDHTFATLSIIDLAGSERAAATRNQGIRLFEGANINKSLLALGNCINALCDPRQRGHIPYRDSKLTRLLKFSLGGNCKTVMIVCVSPSSQHYDETLNTLKYADRAKMIKTKLSRNEHTLDRHVASYLKMIASLRSENAELREREKDAIARALTLQTKQRASFAVQLNSARESIQDWFNIKKKDIQVFVSCQVRRELLRTYVSQLETLLPVFQQSSLSCFAKIQTLLGTIKHELSSIDIYSESATLFTSYDELTHRCIDQLAKTPGWSSQDAQAFETFAALNKVECEKSILYNTQIQVSSDQSTQQVNELIVRYLALTQSNGTKQLSLLADKLVETLGPSFPRLSFKGSENIYHHNVESSLMSIDDSPPPPPQPSSSSLFNNTKDLSPSSSCITSNISAGLRASTLTSPVSDTLAQSQPEQVSSSHPKLSSLARASLTAIPTRKIVVSPVRVRNVSMRKTLSPIKRPTAIRRSPSKRKTTKRVRWQDEPDSDLDLLLEPRMAAYKEPISDSESEEFITGKRISTSPMVLGTGATMHDVDSAASAADTSNSSSIVTTPPQQNSSPESDSGDRRLSLTKRPLGRRKQSLLSWEPTAGRTATTEATSDIF